MTDLMTVSGLGQVLLDTRQDGPLGAAILVAFASITIALIFATVRLLTGPTLADRVVALDLISILLVAMLALFALASQVATYMDAAVVLALVAFLGTVALARFMLRSGRDYAKQQASERNQ
jgi:multicomponent Na+:H+ antiporter subunit F